jgi:hypothetical protein
MFVDRDRTPGQSIPPGGLFHLQHPMGKLHGVVPIDHPLVQQGEDALQVLAGRSSLRGKEMAEPDHNIRHKTGFFLYHLAQRRQHVCVGSCSTSCA